MWARVQQQLLLRKKTGAGARARALMCCIYLRRGCSRRSAEESDAEETKSVDSTALRAEAAAKRLRTDTGGIVDASPVVKVVHVRRKAATGKVALEWVHWSAHWPNSCSRAGAGDAPTVPAAPASVFAGALSGVGSGGASSWGDA